MAVEFRIRSGTESSSGGSDPSNFTDLDSQTQRSAFRGLAIASLIYAGAFFLGYVSDWLVQIAADGRFQFLPLFDTITSVIAIGYSLFVAIHCSRQQCEACSFTPIAVTYLILSSLCIAVQAWGWERTSRFEIETVSWVGVWIVLYPSIVTLPPKRILVASLAAWITVPAVAIVSVAIHGTPADFVGTPAVAITRLSIPVLICVGIACASAYSVFRLARDVSKARRLGSYQLTERIGSGGMGEVWKAKHRMLARPAAVKLIRPQTLGAAPDGTDARTLLRRFEREAQATATLTSPHSIVLYDFGIAQDGAFYYVMELLEGRDLKTLVQEFGPLPAERVVHLLRAACDSLADAHHRGLVHRDVKPANLFACRRGREFDFLKVLDFGLVKTLQERQVSAQLTGDGVTSGTPGFMAPEMVTGEGSVDNRADIYALGCVAYWLLTGRLVFEGKNAMAILVQHAKEEPPAVSSRTELHVPAALESIVHACLAKNPAHRPQSADALAKMLAEVAASLPAWTQERAERWWRMHLPSLHTMPPAEEFDTTAPMVIDA